MTHDGYYSTWDRARNNGNGGWVFHHHDEEVEQQELLNDFTAALDKKQPRTRQQ